MLPVERMTRRSVPHLLAPTVPRIVVEQRGLRSYQQLVEVAG